MNLQVLTRKQTTLEKLPVSKLVGKRQELCLLLRETEALLDKVNAELLERVDATGTDGRLDVDNGVVTAVTRPVFRDVAVETAAKYGALKTVVDSTKLIPLWKQGRRIKGLTVS